jgi:hypothetical protein
MTTINAQTIINEVMAAHAVAPNEQGEYRNNFACFWPRFEPYGFEDMNESDSDYPTDAENAYSALIYDLMTDATSEVNELYMVPNKIKFQTAAKGFHTIQNTKTNLQKFADKVRSNAAAFGGGLVRTVKPRAAIVWPAKLIALFKQSMEDNDFAAALDIGERQLGGIFYDHGLKVAPVPCMEIEGTVSGMLENGTYEVFEPVSGLNVGTFCTWKKDRSRQAAINASLDRIKDIAAETMARSLAAGQSKTINHELIRANWMQAHGLDDDRAIQARIAEQARIDAEREASRAARQAERDAEQAREAVAQLVADAVAAVAMDAAMQPGAELETCDMVTTCEAGEQQAQGRTHGQASTWAPVAQYVPCSPNQTAYNTPTPPAFRGVDAQHHDNDNSDTTYPGDTAAEKILRQEWMTAQINRVGGKSSNWSAWFFVTSAGLFAMAFSTHGQTAKINTYATPKDRMKALQAMAKQADAAQAASSSSQAQATANEAGETPSQAAAADTPTANEPAQAHTPSQNDASATDYTNPRETLGADYTTPRETSDNGALQITITRAEGNLNTDSFEPVTVASFAAANALLHAWSETAPARGGYNKCDFSITWADGSTYSGRYDLKHHSIEPASLTQHMTDQAEFYTGKFCPLHMKQTDYDRFLQNQVSEETRSAYAKVLETMGASGDYFQKQRPVAVDLRAMMAEGMEPANFIGLGVVGAGPHNSGSVEGAIVSVEKSNFHHSGIVFCITLEDGSIDRASIIDFDENAYKGYRLTMKRHGLPYLAQLAATVATVRAQASAAKQQAAEAHAAALVRLAAEFPQLQRAENTYAGGKLAAVNIRTLLKQAFPGQKFSVTSDYNSARICWTDGPTDDQVNAIIARFDIGASDSQSDYFYTVSTAFSQLFGGVQYLSTRREESDELVTRALADLYPAEDSRPTLQDWRKATGAFSWHGPDNGTRSMREHMNSISTYQTPAPKASRKAKA